MILGACSSDDDKTAIVQPQTFLVTKEVQSTTDNPNWQRREFTFDAANNLVSEVTLSTNVTYERTNGKITKMLSTNGVSTRVTTYEYDAQGRLASEEERIQGSNTFIGRYEYTYFADHYLRKYYDEPNNLWRRDEFVWDTAKKNIVKIRMYSGSGFYSGHLEQDFDSARGSETFAPYNQLPKPFYNANNIVEIREYTDSGELMADEGATYEWEYDGFGNPVKQISGTFVKSYTYSVK